MRCPECDLEQHDNATLCAGCGLSFEMWRKHNPPSAKAKPVPPKEMTFPVPEEEKPAPQDRPVEKHISASKGESTVEEPSSKPSSAAGDSSPNPLLEMDLGESKSFHWKPIHWAGLGLATILAFGIPFFIHLALKHSPSPGFETALPSAEITPNSSPAPDNGTNIVSSPEVVSTPTDEPTLSNTLPDLPSSSLANNGGSSSSELPVPTEIPTAVPPTPEPSPTPEDVTPSPQDASPTPDSAAIPDTSTNSTLAAAPDTQTNSASATAAAPPPSTPTNSTPVPAPTSSAPKIIVPPGVQAVTYGPKLAAPATAVASPSPQSTSDLLESDQPLETPTAIEVP